MYQTNIYIYIKNMYQTNIYIYIKNMYQTNIDIFIGMNSRYLSFLIES